MARAWLLLRSTSLLRNNILYNRPGLALNSKDRYKANSNSRSSNNKAHSLATNPAQP